MIRRVLDFTFILLTVWITMLMGLWIIDTIIVPLETPFTSNGYIVGVLQVVVSAFLAFIWLYLWRWLATKLFWRAIENNQNK